MTRKKLHHGWCEGNTIIKRNYPGCKLDCAKEEKCKGIRYVKNTSVCDLVDSCINPNNDAKWGHSLKLSPSAKTPKK